ncbi:MAG: metallopeptidase family protein [Alphaproteobacteria bacterium]|nr:metallopeptidase family protein [Alphaproteobacteria bacterium]MBP9868180.1 metallopeptidase family protein [Alphaproteobacteria bacterium]
MSRHEIIMNFTMSPSLDDLAVMARQILESLPDELSASCEELGLQVEEFPDEAIEEEMDLETPYELLALFRSGKEIAPGVQKKVANEDDVLLLFRRPILDLWCETGDDLTSLVREVVIEEIARGLEFSEDDIKEMILRAHQNAI